MTSYQLHSLCVFALTIVLILGVVFNVLWFKKQENDKKNQVLLKAIEAESDIGKKLFLSSDNRVKEKHTLLIMLILGLALCLFSLLATGVVIYYMCTDDQYSSEGLLACIISFASGSSLLVGYFAGKKLLRPELDSDKGEE